MKGYMDIHCHCLFGLDDGAGNLTESIEMCKTAYESGTEYLFATPHYHPKRGKVDAFCVKLAVDELAGKISSELPKLHLLSGNEIYYDSNTLSHLQKGKVLTLADSRYCLIEFSTEANYGKIRDAVYQLTVHDYSPILAHAERYDCLRKEPQLIGRLIEMGAYIQMNTSSIAKPGSFYNKYFLKQVFREHWIHFVGTDAHDRKVRTTDMSACIKKLEKLAGKEAAHEILIENPMHIIENKIL